MALDGHLEAVTDGSVRFAFTVTNTGDEPEELSFASGLAADVAVYSGGERRWRWSDGRMFAQALRSETLAPGESITFEANWPDPEPGDHLAVATLQATDRDLEATAEISV